jgi:hypothetical protein
MIDIFLKLIEKMIKLAEVREQNREKYIDRYVQPVYADAEAIYKDYSSLLKVVRNKVARGRQVNEILGFLEAKRQENIATRTKVRAILNKRMEEGSFTRFERGIWGLMMGSVTAFDRGHCSFGPVGRGDHTLLDITEHLAELGKSDITEDIRTQMMRFIDRQITGLDGAWDEVVKGYAELVSEAIPKTSLPKKFKFE